MRTIAMATLALLLIAGVIGAGPARAEGARAHKKSGAHTLRKQRPMLVADKGASAKCSVIEFQASKTGTPTVDAKLERYKKALGKAPLSVYDTFRVTGGQDVSIDSGKTGSVKIHAKIDVLYKGPITVKGKQRLEFEVTVDGADGTRIYRQTYKQDNDADLILSAGKYEKTDLFFALTCNAT
jgi:hypothetical protein